MIQIPNNKEFVEKHYDAIKERLITRIKTVLQKKSCNKGTSIVDSTCESYLTNLIDEKSDKYPELEDLIICEPQEFENKIRNIKNMYPSFIDTNEHSNRVLYNIFVSSCYGNKCFDKHNFISKIDLKTCPYCNRNYIYGISRNGKIKPQIDHFYPKSKYPFLAMSFYNLIPSCPTCNGFEAKGEKDPLDKDNELINPYLISSDDFKFSFELKNVSSKDFIEIKLIPPTNGYNQLFKLDELYKKHNDHVEELIFKSEIKYPQSYRKVIEDMFNKSNPKWKQNIDFNRFLLGYYVSEDELHKRPLAKLHKDIALQLGLIE
jgi:hypothetical protein